VETPTLLHAFWETTSSGILCFNKDVRLQELPMGIIEGDPIVLKHFSKVKFADVSGYYVDKDFVCFHLACSKLSRKLKQLPGKFYVAGDFNRWFWQGTEPMALTRDKSALELKMPISHFHEVSHFKFVHESNLWINPFEESPNRVQANGGHVNFQLNLRQTGAHWVAFQCSHSYDLSTQPWLKFGNQSMGMDTLPWALQLYSGKPLGCWMEDDRTYFALFAPRISKVEVHIFNQQANIDNVYPLQGDEEGIWSVHLPGNYVHCYYEFFIYNPEKTKVVDPYAKVLVSPQGPGIIVPLTAYTGNFKTPCMCDLIILEGHVRDITGKSGFNDLSKFLQTDNYVTSLHCNALELLPVNEYDASNGEEYHWGYMPAHYFAPSSSYTESDCGSQVRDFKELVEVCHAKGIAVILDVVYNHAGVFNGLQKIDKAYYFRSTREVFSNFSGCGNDFRSEAPMAKRLILDSLLHFLNVYGIDGFRFDLAELLGVSVLEEIAQSLKAVKSNVILIAEPWSFRSHVALDLKGTDYACWNDGFRDFVLQYVRGQGNVDGLKYFIKGSTDFLCETAQQSINYTESHDDHCWIDRVTENANCNGENFTVKDRRRTHCMLAILYLSLGIPMISAGQDFLKSKKGIRNTYNREDCNRLDYLRLEQFSGTHAYVKGLIELRQSAYGRLLKTGHPSAHYFRCFYAKNSSALVILYNADHAEGDRQILFAINPHEAPVEWFLDNVSADTFVQIADAERLCLDGLNPPLTSWSQEGMLTLPSLSCAIWVSRLL
jgi:pullulanase/glycogen debranching enzyme